MDEDTGESQRGYRQALYGEELLEKERVDREINVRYGQAKEGDDDWGFETYKNLVEEVKK